jgi:hypothetical protein
MQGGIQVGMHREFSVCFERPLAASGWLLPMWVWESTGNE